jgi:ABC-type lipoprotein export system ATPase subunit
MLEAHDLSREYRSGSRSVVAIGGVSLKVGVGEFVAVAGRSGSGKSTLLALLGGLCRPTRGRVIVDGVDLWSLAPSMLADFRAQRVGFVLQFAGLLPALRVVDNVALPALLARRSDLGAAYARAEALLSDVGLADRLDAYPDELSGGEQRRVALARALVNRPPLILADEPTADLDDETERDVVDRLVALHRAQGTTLVLATHSIELARRADRVVTLRAGRLDEAGDWPSSVAVHALRPVATSTARADAAPPAPVGAGLRRFVWSFAIWTMLVVAGIVALDTVVAGLQQRGTTRSLAARNELQRMALQQLRADVEDVTYDADGGYRVTLFMQNLDPERPLYVLGPDARVFIQADRGWKEVPSWAIGGPEGRVVHVAGRRRFELTFKHDVTRFEEQIAGYYHVRITSAMLVSPSREPRGDLFDRTDAYYVYVKPHGADDAEIQRKNAWSSPPPVWIPMPAH